MAKHMVKCFYCSSMFDANSEPFEKVNSRRYAHTECHKKALEGKSKEEKDKQILEDYIKKLFNITQLTPKIRKQINTLMNNKEKSYTYSGIYKTLKYHFEVKHGDIEKANEGIGIVQYRYDEAYKYYYDLWLAKQKNENIEINEFILPTKEIHIFSPKRKPIKQLFNFLDKEEKE